MKYPSMYKSQLARKAGVSSRTFRRWLKSDQQHLAELGISPHTRLLPAPAVRFLCEKYVIEW